MWGDLLKLSGGIRIDPDGRTRGTFTHNPSSLRLSMVDPNLMQIPRGSSEEEKYVKEMFVAPKGSVFWARDFSGIEAVLVGYFAGAPDYIRLAKIDIHSFYTAYCINALEPDRFKSTDLPEISWDDELLRSRLAEIKREFKTDRNELYKHLVHGGNYLQSPHGAQKLIFKETEVNHPVSKIAKVMGVYKELFPEIPKWHKSICELVDGTKMREGEAIDPWSLGVCYAKNPFGYMHHFYNVLEWTKVGDEWVSTFGEDAKRLVSFLPQSTAAGIIKKAAKRLYYEFPHVGNTLRLLIHDEIFGECKEEELEECLEISQKVMEAAHQEMPLDPLWGQGEYLNILTEAKSGASWGTMR
jgi:hypothetical protein